MPRRRRDRQRTGLTEFLSHLRHQEQSNPAATPLPIICATPPRRVGRMEKPADTSAIVAVSRGRGEQRLEMQSVANR